MARRLSAAVAGRIESRGERPFLRAWKTNHVATSLYESLGFEIRDEVNIKVLERPLDGAVRRLTRDKGRFACRQGPAGPLTSARNPSNAIHFNIEAAVPGRDVHEDSRWKVLRKIALVHFVYRRKEVY